MKKYNPGDYVLYRLNRIPHIGEICTAAEIQALIGGRKRWVAAYEVKDKIDGSTWLVGGPEIMESWVPDSTK